MLVHNKKSLYWLITRSSKFETMFQWTLTLWRWMLQMYVMCSVMLKMPFVDYWVFNFSAKGLMNICKQVYYTFILPLGSMCWKFTGLKKERDSSMWTGMNAFHLDVWVIYSITQIKKFKGTNSENMRADFICRCFCTYFYTLQICF